MKKNYDLIFSLGAACSCTQSLRKAGLQLASFPLDWIGVVPPSRKAEWIRDGYPELFELEDFKLMGVHEGHSMLLVRNTRTGMSHPHDFPVGKSIAESYPEVRAKFDRRIVHFDRLLAKSKNILAVYVTQPNENTFPVSEFESCRRILGEKLPHAHIDVLAFQHRADIPFERRTKSSPSGEITVIEFNYHNQGATALRFGADTDLLAAALQESYTVDDYRSDEEKRRYRRLHTKREMDRFGAKTPVGLFFARLKYKIGKHFSRRITSRNTRPGT